MAAKDNKKQTPKGGRPRNQKPGYSRPGSNQVTQPAVSVFANDLGTAPVDVGAPIASRADFRAKRYKGGRAETFVNGRGIDTSRTENSNFVNEVVDHERAMFRRRARAEREDYDRRAREDDNRRYKEQMARTRQDYADRNFRNAAFSTREGWENLGRSKGVDDTGKEVTYGRGADGVKGYDDRYGKLKARADFLTKTLAEGDFANRGKEWEAIRKMVAKTHSEGGLTEKQLDAVEKKMDSLLSERNSRADRINKQQAFAFKEGIQKLRNKIGDTDGMLTDDQVLSTYRNETLKGIRKASDEYSASAKSGGDPTKAMQSLLDNGVSLTEMARLAVQSGDKKWTDAYDRIRKSGVSGAERSQNIAGLGHAYLQSMLNGGEEGTAALTKILDSQGTHSGLANRASKNRIVSWDDMEKPAEPADKPVEPAAGKEEPLPALSGENIEPAAAELQKPLNERVEVPADDGKPVLPMTQDEYERVSALPIAARSGLLPKVSPEDVTEQISSVIRQAFPPAGASGTDPLNPRKKPEEM